MSRFQSAPLNRKLKMNRFLHGVWFEGKGAILEISSKEEAHWLEAVLREPKAAGLTQQEQK